jgi:hypothetical protein
MTNLDKWRDPEAAGTRVYLPAAWLEVMNPTQEVKTLQPGPSVYGEMRSFSIVALIQFFRRHNVEYLKVLCSPYLQNDRNSGLSKESAFKHYPKRANEIGVQAGDRILSGI